MKWYLEGSPIKAVTGHYGSGKTEFALNLAVRAREVFPSVALADADIVNPFFRSAEQADWLRSLGVEPVYPKSALSAIDMPLLPAEIRGLFQRKNLFAILDVGGDPEGAAALGGFWREILETQADVWFVVNPFRPRCSKQEQAEELLRGVEKRGRSRVTGIISSANLADETGRDEILYGRAFCLELSERTGVPFLGEIGTERAFLGVPEDVPRMVIERRLKPEWL